MVTVIITQEVKDFMNWKKTFDSLKYFRDEHGFSEVGVYVNSDNPDSIVLFLDAPSTESVERFFNSTEIKEGMKRAGVITNSNINLLKRIQ